MCFVNSPLQRIRYINKFLEFTTVKLVNKTDILEFENWVIRTPDIQQGRIYQNI